MLLVFARDERDSQIVLGVVVRQRSSRVFPSI
jgi:hypothetical protein